MGNRASADGGRAKFGRGPLRWDPASGGGLRYNPGGADVWLLKMFVWLSLGRGQVARHRVLVPAFAGSNPAAPAFERPSSESPGGAFNPCWRRKRP